MYTTTFVQAFRSWGQLTNDATQLDTVPRVTAGTFASWPDVHSPTGVFVRLFGLPTSGVGYVLIGECNPD